VLVTDTRSEGIRSGVDVDAEEVEQRLGGNDLVVDDNANSDEDKADEMGDDEAAVLQLCCCSWSS
jgi:hypothetical protein